MRVRPVTEGMKRYRAELMERGMKAGDIKATPLHPGDYWEGVFVSGGG